MAKKISNSAKFWYVKNVYVLVDKLQQYKHGKAIRDRFLNHPAIKYYPTLYILISQ